jgi:hypothetical protein
LAGTFAYDSGTQTVTFTPDDYLAMEETYTVTVSGQVDAGGDVQQVSTVWSFTTATPGEAVEDLIDEVKELQTGGSLTRQQAGLLVKTLKAALSNIARGKYAMAVSRLEIFIDLVAGLMDDGVLTDEEGQPLIDVAVLVIEALQ